MANETITQQSRNHAEAVAALREKRKASFEGRWDPGAAAP